MGELILGKDGRMVLGHSWHSSSRGADVRYIAAKLVQ